MPIPFNIFPWFRQLSFIFYLYIDYGLSYLTVPSPPLGHWKRFVAFVSHHPVANISGSTFSGLCYVIKSITGTSAYGLYSQEPEA